MSKKVPSLLLYDSIHDFKRAAVLVESEISRQNIRYDSNDDVQGMNGRKHHDMWVSMKAVSHFNLGTALEIMLKLLLLHSGKPAPGHHKLAKLYGNLDKPDKKQLESKYWASKRESADFALFMFNSLEAEPPPETRSIGRLMWFFEYLDQEVMISTKRYSWEQARDGDWRYYLGDITPVVEFIDRVMNEIPRN